LTITSVLYGQLLVGLSVADKNGYLPYGTYVTAFLTGTGGVGTYTLSNAPTTDPTGTETFTGQATFTVYDAVYIKTPISVGGIVLFGIYQLVGGGQGQYTINAATPATSTVADGGVLPVFTSIAGQSTVTVTLPNHGYIEGDTFTILNITGLSNLTLYGQYLVGAYPTTDTFTIQATSQALASDTAYMNASYFSGTGSVAGTTLTITAVSSGSLFVGSVVSDASGYLPANTYVTAILTGSGGVGTYTLSDTPTTDPTGSETISGVTGLANYDYFVGNGPPSSGGGYGVGPYGGGGYGIGSQLAAHIGYPLVTSDWFLGNFGEILIANPYNGPLYLWNPNQGIQNATVIAAAPPVNAGFFIAMPERQIVAWGSTFTGIQDPLLIRWCDVENYTSWIASSTNQAGSYRIPTGNRIVACIQASQQALIFTDIDIYAMQYVQPPLVYGFNKIASGCGLIAPKAVAQQGPNVYWMSQRQFFMATGQGVQPIDCPVWDYIYQNLDFAHVNKIRAASNSQFHEIAWYFPSANSGVGEVTNYVKFNTLENVWDFGELARTAWIDQSVLGPPIGAGIDYYLYQHEISQSADGVAMPSYIQSGYLSLNNAEDFSFVDYMIPDMKYGYYGSGDPAQVDFYINVKNYPNDPPVTYGPYTSTSSTEVLNGVRFRGRYIQFQIGDTSPNNPGTYFWRVGNIRYRIATDGRR
jgi:hypothetical protein